MGAILSYPDRTLAASLSGGSWSSSYPLANLQNGQMGVKARTTNTISTSSIILVDIGATARTIQCLAVLSHNISFSGTILARGYSDAGYTTLVTGANTGTQYAYPQTLTAEKAAQYPNHWIYALPAGVTARYWKIEIIDTGNGYGYIELGRVWIGEATLAPVTTINKGFSLVYESREITGESLGGAIWGDGRPPRRVMPVTWGYLTPAEKRTAIIMQKTLGKTGELLYITDSGAAAADMILEAFPANIRTVSPLTYPFYHNNEMPVELAEKL